MLAIVRIALSRPYTFIVAALLILLIGTLAALRMPVDIFPSINIPIIGVAWQYQGLPPDQMAGRIITPFERALTTTVNDIEHIEANSYTTFGIVKIFFHPTVNIATANAQVTAISQTLLKQMPPGATPPLIVNYSASTVPIIQLALSGKGLTEQNLADLGMNFVRPRLVTVQGAGIPWPFGGKTPQVMFDLDTAALQSRGLTGLDVANALAAQNLITPAGTEKIGNYEYTVNLNSAPSKIPELGDLPIKSVGGAMVYMHDVAQVHNGNAVQTNIVHVDGNRSVLLSVFKNGTTSTLDIVSGIKKMLTVIKPSLPDALDIKPIGDQSIFVRASIQGVIREGVIAAALTSLMILLFLGSWRSTLIVTTSIPLSILGAIGALSAIGETLNIMTLGGLALAVGILVDEATVTIESINYHLEQGKEVETAIIDGASQIVVPAFVSLLCICIVFIPMFFLSGVARFLFVPMAESVMFAMVCSFLLSRTLVPTMAKYLLRKHVAARRRARQRHRAAAVEEPAGALSARLRGALRAAARRVSRSAGARHRASQAVRRGLSRLHRRLVPARAVSRPQFLPAGRRRSDPAACAGAGRHAYRGNRRAFRRGGEGDPRDDPADRSGGGGRQHRHVSFVDQYDLQQHRHDRRVGRRHPDLAQRGARADRRLRQSPARGAAAPFPRHDLLVSARRYRQPDPQFRRAGADRSAGPRQRSRRGLCLRQQAAGADPPDHRRGRCTHPAVGRAADARCQHRPHARAIHRRDRGRRDQQPGRQPGQFQPGCARLLAQREERRHLSDRAADAAIPDRHAAGAAESADQRHRRADHGARRHRRHPPHPQRRRGLAVRHLPDGADLRDDPGARSRRGLRATSRRSSPRTTRTSRKARSSPWSARRRP